MRSCSKLSNSWRLCMRTAFHSDASHLVCVCVCAHMITNLLCRPKQSHITDIWGFSAILAFFILIIFQHTFIYLFIYSCLILYRKNLCWQFNIAHIQNNGNVYYFWYYLSISLLFSTSLSTPFRPTSGTKMTSASLLRWRMARWRKLRPFLQRKVPTL